MVDQQPFSGGARTSPGGTRRRWETVRWIDQYSDKRYRISASAAQPSRTMARVKSYADVLREYEYHPESKCADWNGKPCRKQTVGLLGRRHVAMDGFTYIGKESNNLEEVEAETASDATEVYTEYPDPQRDEWTAHTLPAMRATSAQVLVQGTGISRRTIQRIRNEQTKPTVHHKRMLEAFIRALEK
jgi:hypothetical protein